MFLEPKRIYRFGDGRGPRRRSSGAVRQGAVRAGGTGRVTLFAYGAMIPPTVEAAETLGPEGISAEVVDLRSLVPLDEAAVVASVEKTGTARSSCMRRPASAASAAEIAAILAEKAFYSLKAPIARVTGYDTPFPYALENLYLPSAERIATRRGPSRASG